MTWKECVRLIKTDLLRTGCGHFVIAYLWDESFKVTLWFRLGSYLQKKKLLFPIYGIVRVIYKHVQHKAGIQLPVGTKIGNSLRSFHHDCITIAQSSKIGENASIHQGVTIGRVFNGCKSGVPTIGNNVVIFAGAKILGNIKIGDNAVIGSNAAVTNDIPENAVAVGVPARVISLDSNKCFNKYWGAFFL